MADIPLVVVHTVIYYPAYVLICLLKAAEIRQSSRAKLELVTPNALHSVAVGPDFGYIVGLGLQVGQRDLIAVGGHITIAVVGLSAVSHRVGVGLVNRSPRQHCIVLRHLVGGQMAWDAATLRCDRDVVESCRWVGTHAHVAAPQDVDALQTSEGGV